MKNKYGSFGNEQFQEYKEKLHKEIHWLLIYKDPKCSTQYENIDYDKYYDFLMRKINGLNSLIKSSEIIELMALLEAAYLETKKDIFDFKNYRKLIFDAQTIVNKIDERRD